MGCQRSLPGWNLFRGSRKVLTQGHLRMLLHSCSSLLLHQVPELQGCQGRIEDSHSAVRHCLKVWATPPSTAGTFRIPQTLQFKALEGSWLQSISRILSPPVRLRTPLFSEVVSERASQSRSWNSQQYWGCFSRSPSELERLQKTTSLPKESFEAIFHRLRIYPYPMVCWKSFKNPCP